MVTGTWIAVLLASALSRHVGRGGDERRPAAEPDEAAQVKGNSEFAFDLYGRLRLGTAMCSSPRTAFPMPWPCLTRASRPNRHPDGQGAALPFPKMTGCIEALPQLSARSRLPLVADLRVANAL